jgi:putative endonuclease
VAATHAQRKALGDFGERVAVQHLTDAGFTVLERNWRCSAGEIDIVASDDRVLVICEVKTRSSARYGTPLEAITPEKACRLYRLGSLWAKAHPEHRRTLRVDVISVGKTRHGWVVLEHLVGVC